MKENLINKSKQLEINFESKKVVKSDFVTLNEKSSAQIENIKVISINRTDLQINKSKEQDLLNYILKQTKSF